MAIKVVTDPAGASVTLAGKPIGTTPLATHVPRGSGQAALTIRLAGYGEVSTRLDLASDGFSTEVTLTKLAEAMPPREN